MISSSRTSLIYSFGEHDLYHEGMRKLISEGLRCLDTHEWFIASMTYKGQQVKCGLFEVDVKMMQMTYNETIDKMLPDITAIDIYTLSAYQGSTDELNDLEMKLYQIEEENDSTVIKESGWHVDGYLAVVTDDIPASRVALSSLSGAMERHRVVIYGNSEVAKCDGCNILHPLYELRLDEGDLYCKKCPICPTDKEFS